ncbi:MAG: hypothetical protein R3C44_18240 [Chloroflexota bacterium]
MRRKAAGLALFVLGCLLLVLTESNTQGLSADDTLPGRVVVTGVDYLGQASFTTGEVKDGTEIGGLSATPPMTRPLTSTTCCQMIAVCVILPNSTRLQLT